MKGACKECSNGHSYVEFNAEDKVMDRTKSEVVLKGMHKRFTLKV